MFANMFNKKAQFTDHKKTVLDNFSGIFKPGTKIIINNINHQHEGHIQAIGKIITPGLHYCATNINNWEKQSHSISEKLRRAYEPLVVKTINFRAVLLFEDYVYNINQITVTTWEAEYVHHQRVPVYDGY